MTAPFTQGSLMRFQRSVKNLDTVAKYVTESNDEDGVAKFIEQKLLCGR